jgi:serine/threonine protein phosphatase PrpC
VHAELGGTGSTTLVLPDHFYTGAYECYRDSFPRQTNFLLCSDGLYGAFSNWAELYEWLRLNAAALNSEVTRQTLLEQLHERLNSSKGDDDISLIWVQPRESFKREGG